jgi:CheY-like chemotaxis protein
VEPGPILLVKDEPVDVRLVKRALERAELDNPLVIASTRGEAQKACASDGAPVLILLGVYPQRDAGFDFLEWLRAQPKPLGDTPVVIFSVSTDHSHGASAAALRGAVFLDKPATEEVLAEAIAASGLARTTEIQGGKRRRWLTSRGEPEVGDE